MQGKFPALCHNDIRDITARHPSEVCPNVEVEPELQVLSERRGSTSGHPTWKMVRGLTFVLRVFGETSMGAHFLM